MKPAQQSSEEGWGFQQSWDRADPGCCRPCFVHCHAVSYSRQPWWKDVQHTARNIRGYCKGNAAERYSSLLSHCGFYCKTNITRSRIWTETETFASSLRKDQDEKLALQRGSVFHVFHYARVAVGVTQARQTAQPAVLSHLRGAPGSTSKASPISSQHVFSPGCLQGPTDTWRHVSAVTPVSPTK